MRSHGSIKEMEKAFGISYPTVKNRLNRIAGQLKLVEVAAAAAPTPAPAPQTSAPSDDVLGMLERGEISATRGGEEASVMSMPPAILDLRICQPESRPIRLWLPLFLLWPLALVLGVLALVLTILADVVLYVIGQPYHHYTLLLVKSLGVLNATRGTVVHIRDGKTAVDMTVL